MRKKILNWTDKNIDNMTNLKRKKKENWGLNTWFQFKCVWLIIRNNICRDWYYYETKKKENQIIR